MQAANMRAAANHEIQSPGAEITKSVQRRIWDLQPAGVHEWRVGVMNIHDELMCVTHPDYVGQVTTVVTEAVEAFRPKVPLIGLDWNEEMMNWAEKKSGAAQVKIRAAEMG
jgi:DNA polymerase I-like protein with 3'-5' exonuclease and polymerase domains